MKQKIAASLALYTAFGIVLNLIAAPTWAYFACGALSSFTVMLLPIRDN